MKGINGRVKGICCKGDTGHAVRAFLLRNGNGLWQSVLDFIHPRHCVACGRLADTSVFQWLCRGCGRNLPVVWRAGCPRCGHPEIDFGMSGLPCPRCAQYPPHFTEGRTLLRMEGVGRRWVHALKYNGCAFLMRDISALAERIPGIVEWLSHSTLVPVPLHRKRLRERGYNQSVILARALSRTNETVVVKPLLRRVRATVSQTGMNPEQRAKNVKNVFGLRGRYAEGTLPQERYILVDDVLTTGATLNACARVLLRAGAPSVSVITLAQG